MILQNFLFIYIYIYKAKDEGKIIDKEIEKIFFSLFLIGAHVNGS